MNNIHAIVFGIVQGLTEFLPISSTAHLRIVPAILGWEDPGAAFTAVTQLGTMAAVVATFRRDLLRIARTWLASLSDATRRSDLDARMGWYIGFGTVPIAVVGFVLRHVIESGARNLTVIALALIVGGVILGVADRTGGQAREFADVDHRDATIVGLAQAVALVPGVSRSGATLSAGLLRGLTRPAAARYSFLLSVPAVVLAGLFELGDIVGGPGAAGAMPTLVATALAFVVGYASIAGLLRLLATRSTMVFVAYRVVLGLAVLVLAAGDWIH